MIFARFLAPLVGAGLLASLPVSASHLVTGNGFGFAVVSPDNATVSKFYAHPYSFVRPDPRNPLSEGIETANFLTRLGWNDEIGVSAASADYEEDSHVIHARSGAGEGYFFMPFGLSRPALIVAWDPTLAASHGSLTVEWAHAVASQKTLHISGVDASLLQFEGEPELLLLVPLGPPRPANPQQILAASNAWALISLGNAGAAEMAASETRDAEMAVGDLHAWRAGLAPRALAAREIAELDRWRVPPSVHFTSEEERHLWRQSEVMLRIAQSREPNRPGRNGNGLIVAALPDGVYFTPWVRDMAYALVAFIRMGHQAEARAGLLAYFNAQPTGKMRAQTAGVDYQISVVRYFGDGSEEPFFTQEGATNIEFDDWGLALWALCKYERRFNDPALLNTPTYRGPLYQSARDFVVKPLLANLEPYGTADAQIVAADTSIWEEHQKDRKHFAWSTALAIVGLENFAAVARRAGDEPARTLVLAHAAQLRKGFAAAFIRDGQLHGTIEPGIKNDIDGALLPIVNFGLVTDPALIRDTLRRMALLKVASGGYRRVRGTYTDPAIFEYWYEQQEFLFVDFSLAELLRRQGRPAQAASILSRIVAKAAAGHNIIPEMYVAVSCKLFPGQIGSPTGALPMVGYGAGEYILYLLDREADQP